MQFEMQLVVVGVRAGSSDKQSPLGTWSAGFNNNLTLQDPQSMSNFTADVVFRIVTVEVSVAKIHDYHKF